MADSPPSPIAARALSGLSGLLILGIVVTVYLRDPAPPGHPWSGITLVLLAITSLARATFPVQSRTATLSLVALSALAIPGAALWLASAWTASR